MINKALFTSNKEDWETPQYFYDKLNAKYHFQLMRLNKLIVDFCRAQYYNYNIKFKEVNMDNKPVASSVRLSEEERSKLRELKEQHGISWEELIAYTNRVISEDV